MLSKGVVQNIAHIVLILMVGGVIATTLGGPIYNAIEDGFNDIEQFLGMADRVKLSDEGEHIARKELATLARYSWDRAHHCDYVKETKKQDGYKFLSDTSYADPPCAGQGGTLAAGIWANLLGNSGNDMEGRFSRIEFVVKDEITLTSYREYPKELRGSDGWKGNSEYDVPDGQGTNNYGFLFKTLSKTGKSYQEYVDENCGLTDQPTGTDHWAVRDTTNQFSWPIVFTESIDKSRYTLEGAALTWSQAESKGTGPNIGKKAYCSERTIEGGYMVASGNVNTWNGKKGGKDGNVTLKLCPGDKGYVQVNKGKASNQEESTYQGDVNYFPYIQITDINDSYDCDVSTVEKVPKGENAVGSELNIEADLQANPKKVKDMKRFELKKSNLGSCRLSLTEVDPAFSESGHLDYKAGAILPKKGTFYSIGSSYIDSVDLNRENNLILSGIGTRGFYDYLSIYDGLDGSSVSSKNVPVLNRFNGKTLEMYGDLLCTHSTKNTNSPLWIMCDESVTWLNKMKDPEVTVNTGSGSKVYECDMESGAWSPE